MSKFEVIIKRYTEVPGKYKFPYNESRKFNEKKAAEAFLKLMKKNENENDKIISTKLIKIERYNHILKGLERIKNFLRTKR